MLKSFPFLMKNKLLSDVLKSPTWPESNLQPQMHSQIKLIPESRFKQTSQRSLRVEKSHPPTCLPPELPGKPGSPGSEVVPGPWAGVVRLAGAMWTLEPKGSGFLLPDFQKNPAQPSPGPCACQKLCDMWVFCYTALQAFGKISEGVQS